MDGKSERIPDNSLVMITKDGARTLGFLKQTTEGGDRWINVKGEMLKVNPQDVKFIMPMPAGGTTLDPEKYYRQNFHTALLYDILEVLQWVGVIKGQDQEIILPEPILEVPVPAKTLAIILPDKSRPLSPCWGITKPQGIGGSYDVQISASGWRRALHLKTFREPPTTIVKPGRIIPVLLTDGSYKDPSVAAKDLAPEILLRMKLIRECASASGILRSVSELHRNMGTLLQNLGEILRNDPLLALLSRQGKIPPQPEKPPE